MGTTAYKVEVAVSMVPIVRPKVSYLHEIVTKAECGPFRKVVDTEPVAGSIAHLKFQMLFQIK
jgi:hypothetical protein